MPESKRKLRILFSSNAPWAPSGYSQQIADLLPALRDAGYEIGIVNFYGQEGGIFALDGITCFPRLGDIWGTDAVLIHQKTFKPDCVITFQDVWPMDPNNVRQFKNFIPMLPIDHDPIPPAVFDRAKLAYRVVTHSRFGEDQLQKKGMHSTYIPLLVDTEKFQKRDKALSRKALGIPDDIFLFGMVAANKDNPPRKSFQEVMDAFVLFHAKHPKSGLYIHSILNQQNGFPIDQYARFLGIDKFLYSIDPIDQLYHVDKEKMSAVYSTFDCLLAPSISEGFGVPIVEAQSCQVPVITNTFASMPELIVPGKTGYLVDVAYKRFSALLSYTGVPSVQSIYNRMIEVFKADRVAMGKAGREYVVANYDLKTNVKERWIKFLNMLEDELIDK